LTVVGGGNSKGMARLENYSFGRLTVDGDEQTRDLVAIAMATR
jgi:hypothetical protein